MLEPSRGLSPNALDALRRQIRGAVLVSGDAAYPCARRVWNAAVERCPAGIVQCADAEDVAYALRIAADAGVPVTVRGGGHNVAGRAVRDDALLLDLSRLRSVTVNVAARTATVQGGALWRDVDAATAVAGLATTGGLVSSTGVGGLTLGGGAGWLMRKAGLASDNVCSAQVVAGNGRILRASPDEHAELYWGLRGGASPPGVVTSFEFRLHPLEHVLAGLVVHRADDAGPVLRAFRDYAAAAADEFCGLAVLAHAPALPFIDAAWHGRPVLLLAMCWSGDIDAGARALAPLRAAGRPIADHVGVLPYAQWQLKQDPGAPPGRHHYWKTANYRELSDATIGQLAEIAHDLPTPFSEIHVQHMGGAVARRPPGDSAFAHRSAAFFINMLGVAVTPQEFDPLRQAIRAIHQRLSPGALATILPNFGGEDDTDPGQRIGPHDAQRLEALRRHYDPGGVLAHA